MWAVRCGTLYVLYKLSGFFVYGTLVSEPLTVERRNIYLTRINCYLKNNNLFRTSVSTIACLSLCILSHLSVSCPPAFASNRWKACLLVPGMFWPAVGFTMHCFLLPRKMNKVVHRCYLILDFTTWLPIKLFGLFPPEEIHSMHQNTLLLDSSPSTFLLHSSFCQSMIPVLQQRLNSEY